MILIFCFSSLSSLYSIGLFLISIVCIAQSFTNVEGNANSLGNYKLLLLEDRHIKNWQWHKLINIKEHLYSNVRDYSWARWICHVDAIRALAEHVGINDIPINIPYDSKTGTLILPNQLTLPYLLARAIALSSGFAPDYLKNHPAWQAGRVNENVFFTPGNPYNGSCWEWKGIPVTIADNVLAKVTANPVEWAKI